MAKFFRCWVIVAGTQPTAFRARDAEDLVPTLRQLQRTQSDVSLMWFERGRLWPSPDEARHALLERRRQPTGRGRDWRPGGNHKDPRAKFDVPRDVKRARFKKRLIAGRIRDEETGPSSRPPSGGSSGPSRAPGSPNPSGPRGARPFRNGPPASGTRPGGPKPFKPFAKPGGGTRGPGSSRGPSSRPPTGGSSRGPSSRPPAGGSSRGPSARRPAGRSSVPKRRTDK